MKLLAFVLLFQILSLEAFSQPIERRLALVIGNSEYSNENKLFTPVNDADLITTTLNDLGFSVIKKTNQPCQGMKQIINDFFVRISNYDAVLFYYAGHGLQMNNINYLIPIDAKLDDLNTFNKEVVSLNYIAAKLNEHPNKKKIIILDAFPDQMFKTRINGWQRGFKALPDIPNSCIAFATAEGVTTPNRLGINGLFTEKLVLEMKKPQNLLRVFTNTNNQVAKESFNQQLSDEWIDNLEGFYFNRKGMDLNPASDYLQSANLSLSTVELTSDIGGDLLIDGKPYGNIKPDTTILIKDISVGEHVFEIKVTEIWSKKIFTNQGEIHSLFAESKDLQKNPANRNILKKKLALVIGNGNYLSSVLANPENDAKSMKVSLMQIGFDVLEYENLNQSQMKKAIDEFGQQLKNYEVGLFYYAGHGIQSKGYNYLIPTDANINSEEQIEYDCIQADRVLAFMESSKAKVNIIILDACRNNPFERSWSRSANGNGLAFMNAPSGTLIAYATSPRSTASDGTGKNGLYTSAILESIFNKEFTITQVFQNVAKIVTEKSNRQQIPWVSSSLTDDFYFVTPDN